MNRLPPGLGERLSGMLKDRLERLNGEHRPVTRSELVPLDRELEGELKAAGVTDFTTVFELFDQAVKQVPGLELDASGRGYLELLSTMTPEGKTRPSFNPALTNLFMYQAKEWFPEDDTKGTTGVLADLYLASQKDWEPLKLEVPDAGWVYAFPGEPVEGFTSRAGAALRSRDEMRAFRARIDELRSQPAPELSVRNLDWDAKPK